MKLMKSIEHHKEGPESLRGYGVNKEEKKDLSCALTNLISCIKPLNWQSSWEATWQANLEAPGSDI